VSAILARVARLLDLERPSPGERTHWTVRTEHGVHLVELDQFVSGTRVRVDGQTVGRSPAWAFPAAPFRFTVGTASATLALSPDTASGTVRATLIVDGARIRPDRPAPVTARPFAWARFLARAGYGLGALLIVAAVLGDPYGSWVMGWLRTAVNVAWVAAVRGIDPFALIPGWLATIASSRAAMLLAGIELLALVRLARDAAVRDRVPGLRSPSRFVRVLTWAMLGLGAAILPTLLGD
jgi:hypothetical protein